MTIEEAPIDLEELDFSDRNTFVEAVFEETFRAASEIPGAQVEEDISDFSNLNEESSSFYLAVPLFDHYTNGPARAKFMRRVLVKIDGSTILELRLGKVRSIHSPSGSSVLQFGYSNSEDGSVVTDGEIRSEDGSKVRVSFRGENIKDLDREMVGSSEGVRDCVFMIGWAREQALSQDPA